MERRPSYKPNRQRTKRTRFRIPAGIDLGSGRSWDAGWVEFPAGRPRPKELPSNLFESQQHRSLNIRSERMRATNQKPSFLDCDPSSALRRGRTSSGWASWPRRPSESKRHSQAILSTFIARKVVVPKASQRRNDTTHTTATAARLHTTHTTHIPSFISVISFVPIRTTDTHNPSTMQTSTTSTPTQLDSLYDWGWFAWFSGYPLPCV